MFYVLRNWWLDVFSTGERFAGGMVYGNPRFPEGKTIHTSVLQRAEVRRDAILFYTVNSIYVCRINEYLGGPWGEYDSRRQLLPRLLEDPSTRFIEADPGETLTRLLWSERKHREKE